MTDLLKAVAELRERTKWEVNACASLEWRAPVSHEDFLSICDQLKTLEAKHEQQKR